MGMFGYIFKVNKIQRNLGSSAIFSIYEIASTLVNLIDAKKNLNSREYSYVCLLFDSYKKCDKVNLDYEGFIKTGKDIMASFDLIAPYYKFCGKAGFEFEKAIDFAKQSYRNDAQTLLDNGKLFSDDWMNLLEEFVGIFYNT